MTLLGDKVVSAMRQHPWVLAIVVVNVLFLGYVVREVGASGARKDALIAELSRDCVKR